MKKRILFLLLSLIVILAVSAAALYPNAIKPMLGRSSDYKQAQKLLASGNYDDALYIFALLGSYKDAPEMVYETLYAKAESLLAQENYSEAIRTWGRITDYRDSAERIQSAYDDLYEARYVLANEAVAEDADYDRARRLLKPMEDYRDSSELYVMFTYTYADELLDEGEYLHAIELLEEIPDYEDAAQKAMDAKFLYVDDLHENSDMLAYEYMQELTAAEYPGAEELYEELYAWHVEVYAIGTEEEDDEELLTETSKYNTVYFFYTLSGGAPGARTELSVKISFPSGGENDSSLGNLRSGYKGYCFAGYDNPRLAPAGTMKATFLDGEENEIGEAEIKLVG